MSYLVMEEGALHNPMNRRPLGPVKFYRTHSDSGISRGLNPVESLAVFSEIEARSIGMPVDAVAPLYLAAFRSLLARFDTQHHVIWVDASDTPTVRVGTSYAARYSVDNDVTDCLKCIDQMLGSAEGAWVYALHGERLNGPAKNVLPCNNPFASFSRDDPIAKTGNPLRFGRRRLRGVDASARSEDLVSL